MLFTAIDGIKNLEIRDLSSQDSLKVLGRELVLDPAI